MCPQGTILQQVNKNNTMREKNAKHQMSLWGGDGGGSNCSGNRSCNIYIYRLFDWFGFVRHKTLGFKKNKKKRKKVDVCAECSVRV